MKNIENSIVSLPLIKSRIIDGKRVYQLKKGEFIDANKIPTLCSTKMIYTGQETVNVNSVNLMANVILLGDREDPQSNVYNINYSVI